MAGKANKGLGTYIIMFLGLALALAIILFGTMMIANIEIFGLKYMNVTYADTLDRYNDAGEFHSLKYFNETGESSTLLNGVSKVVVKTDKHSVTVRSKVGITNPFITRETNFTGFFKTKEYKDEEGKTTNPMLIKTSFSGGVLTIALTSPKGLIITNNGEIVVTLPENMSGVEIVAETTKGSINLGGENEEGTTLDDFNTSNINLTTVEGDITLRKYVAIGGSKADIKTEKGRINIYNGFNNKSNLVANLITKSGVINADKTEDGGVQTFSANKLDVTSSLSDVKFGIVEIGDSNYGVKFHGTNGRLIVSDSLNTSLTCDDVTGFTDFNIKKITGDFYMPNGENNSITIEESTGKIIIVGKSGELNINKAIAEVSVEMKSASVNIKDASQNVIAKTTTGKVSLTNCPKFSVETTKGDVTLDITTLTALSGGARHSVTSEKGDIVANIKGDLVFNLKTEAGKSVSIKIGAVNDPAHTREVTTNQINGGNANKLLSLKTKGRITVAAKIA